MRERAFANKIWNASRLLFSKSKEGAGEPVSLADRWIASRLNAAPESANKAFEHHRYHEAADDAVSLLVGRVLRLVSGIQEARQRIGAIAYVVYEKALRLLHPLMPFITEELWQRLETGGKSIALAPYPSGGTCGTPS